jgi:hypothetical protein
MRAGGTEDAPAGPALDAYTETLRGLLNGL